jgi:hypothetical protein
MPAAGHYTIAEALEFQDLMPPLGTEAARIRLKVGGGLVLDLPLSEGSLVALSHFLIPKFPPAGWKKVD